jgi:hypothetical protein
MREIKYQGIQMRQGSIFFYFILFKLYFTTMPQSHHAVSNVSGLLMNDHKKGFGRNRSSHNRGIPVSHYIKRKTER